MFICAISVQIQSCQAARKLNITAVFIVTHAVQTAVFSIPNHPPSIPHQILDTRFQIVYYVLVTDGQSVRKW